MPPRPIKAIIFDVDGTLIDSPQMIYAAKRHLAQQFGLPLRTDAEIRAQIGKPMTEIFLALWPDADPLVLLAANNEFVARNSGLARLYPGVVSALEQFQQQGILLGALTSAGAGVDSTLRHHKINQFFLAVVHSEMVKKYKPDPEGLLLILRMLNVAPQDAIMVGDMHYDIQAGQNAGVRATVGFTHGFGSRKSLIDAQATHILDSFGHLSAIVA